MLITPCLLRACCAAAEGTDQVSGSTTFYDLTVSSTTGKQLVLPASISQSVTNALSLQGAAGSLLQIASSVAGQRALLAVSPAASQAVSYVSVRDNEASAATIAPGAAASYHSVDAGDLVNWFAGSVTSPGSMAVPAPAMDARGLVVLLIGLLLAAWGVLRGAGLSRLKAKLASLLVETSG